MRNFHAPVWYVDAAYGVHSDFKSHSGGLLQSSNSGGGAITAGSCDFMSRILHMQHFLRAQGVAIKKSTLYQDNKSAILLSEKGRASLGRRTRHFALRYFLLLMWLLMVKLKSTIVPQKTCWGIT